MGGGRVADTLTPALSRLTGEGGCAGCGGAASGVTSLALKSTVIVNELFDLLPTVSINRRHGTHEDVVDACYLLDLCGAQWPLQTVEMPELHGILLVGILVMGVLPEFPIGYT